MKRMLFILILFSLLVGCAKYTGEDFSRYKGLSAKEIFVHGEQSLADDDYKDAIRDFEALDALYPFSNYSQQAQLDIIYAYYKHDDLAESLVATDRYIRLYPRGRNVDYAYYMKGLVYYQTGFTWLQRSLGVDPAERDLTDKKQSFMAFSELVHAFPRSRYVGDALLHMRYIRNMVAQQQIDAAKFYMKRKAYVAAANRASYVIEHFNGTPQVVPALAIMVKAYRELNLNHMADNTMKIFHASYPDSKEYQALAS